MEAASQRNWQAAETEEESNTRQAIDKEQHAIRQQIDAVIAEVNSHLEYQNGVDNENTIEEHFCGLMNVVCAQGTLMEKDHLTKNSQDVAKREKFVYQHQNISIQFFCKACFRMIIYIVQTS